MKKAIFIVGNWKCNPTSLKEAKGLFAEIEKGKNFPPRAKVVICPPFVYLPFLQGKKVLLGGQNCWSEEKGAFTGEISAKMLKDFCQFVIIGHSERRKYFHEKGKILKKKLNQALKAGLYPIFCIGETKEERKRGNTNLVLKKQLRPLLEFKNRSRFMVAYEPVWAIGSGNPCLPEKAKEVLVFVRRFLKKHFKKRIPVLYGGSVNSKNAAGYISVGFDGLLIGGASLKPKEFKKIIALFF